MKIITQLLCLILTTALIPAMALKVPLPKGDVFGEINSTIVEKNKTLFEIARQYDLGFFELVEANPNVNPDQLIAGTDLVLPTRFILPAEKREGIIINLGTMRLYYFPKNKDYFYTYPIGIGKENWETPLGTMTIIEKTKDPIWIVPKSIFDYRKAHGDPVPKIVPAGKDNPLGRYAMRLSRPTYLIHGTNDPTSVGVRSSAGCIHLYPEDIQELFENIPLKTPVTIINKPYLFGSQNNQLLVEAHLPLAEVREQYANIEEDFEDSEELKKQPSIQLNKAEAVAAIKNHLGVPQVIGNVDE